MLILRQCKLRVRDRRDNVEIGTYQILEHSNSQKTIVKCSAPNVDVIPAHIDLVAIEIELVEKNREYMLKKH
jgi:chromosome partitioning protein